MDENRDEFEEKEQEKTKKPIEDEFEEFDFKKPQKQFNINLDKLDKQLKDIPDYAAVANVKVRKKSRFGVFVKIMFGFIIVGLSVVLSIAIIFAAQDMFGIGKPDSTCIVDIEKNSSVSQIALILEENEVINSAFMFRAYYKFTKSEANFQFGTYPLNSNMSYGAIIDELEKYSESKAEARVTFPEGSTLYDMAVLLQENKVCNAKEFLNAIDSESFGFAFENNIWENDLRFHRLEGYAFPDTYNFFIDETPISVAKRLLQNYEDKVTELLNQKAEATGLTQEKIIIIASIVQREAPKVDEMKKVASVYLNRLKTPKDFTRLQADPTREYANQLKLQMDIIDQDVLDAYNTYVGQGLPPGPICNPGIDAIKAVLEPEETDFYYFCTDLSSGKFYYAATLAEHNKNVKKAGLRQ